MSLLGSVNPRNTGREGGSFTGAGQPTNVNGAFSSVGSANAPGGAVGTPGVNYARNNRGSNVRIPYARLVPMRSRTGTQTVSGRPDVLEYEGLEAGELAWILGRRLRGGIAAADGGGDAATDNGADGGVGYFDWAEAGQSAHALGMGHGVDRMQRLASTAWIESFFRGSLNGLAGANMAFNTNLQNFATLKPTTINLMAIRLGAATTVDGNDQRGGAPALDPGRSQNGVLDSDLAFYQAFLTHGTAIYAPDVAWIASRAYSAVAEDMISSQASVGLGGHGNGRSAAPGDLAALVASTSVANGPLADKLALAMGYKSADEIGAAYGYADIAEMRADAVGKLGNPKLTNLVDGQTTQTDVSVGRQSHGLFVMERGPFLRSKAVGGDTATFPNSPRMPGKREKMIDTARQLGSELAWAGLNSELRRKNFFDWVPDGVVLSKFETGPNPQSDAELDARMGQLFNVAIQGQAISKTWSGKSEMAVLPMDKVFVCLVADLTYTLSEDGSKNQLAKDRDVETAKLLAEIQNVIFYGGKSTAAEIKKLLESLNTMSIQRAELDKVYTESAALVDQLAGNGSKTNQGAFAPGGTEVSDEGAATAIKKYLYNLNRLRETESNMSDFESSRKDAQLALDKLKTSYKFNKEINSRVFDAVAQGVRVGDIDVTQADLRNFRMVRMTSSYLAQYSHFDPNDEKSRCGLKISAWGKNGKQDPNKTCVDDMKALDKAKNAEWQAAMKLADPEAREKKKAEVQAGWYVARANCIQKGVKDSGKTGICGGIGEYIIGGWCIGTVLDSAASRAMVGQSVRIAPASMSININVNVEWWTGDKLYQNYMDVDGTCQRRGQIPRYGNKQSLDTTTNSYGAKSRGTYAAQASVQVSMQGDQYQVTEGTVKTDASRSLVLVDMHGAATPRPASRGPRDGWAAGLRQYNVAIIPHTAY